MARRRNETAVAVVEAQAVAVIPQADSVLAVISRAAADPTIDVTKLERLLEMHERITAKQAETAFNDALSVAQSQVGRIAADASNPQTRSKYASYAKMDRVIRPVYSANGFSLSFDTAESPHAEYVRVVCHVSHKAGHTRTYHVDMPADGKGAKGGDVMTKTHAAGSAMSYGMRYLLKMIFNVAVGEEDDDGNAAGGHVTQHVTAAQAADLAALAEEVGADLPKFLAYMKAGSLETIPAADYHRAVKALEAKRRAA